jgi:DNA polymerase (family 10)
MKRLRNSEIARVLDDIASLLDLKGENPFRVRAYRQAASLIASLPEPIHDIAADEARALTDLPGIGKDLAAKITELLETGRLEYFDALAREVPPTLIEVMKLEGIGPKKAAALWRELGVETVDDLEAAVESGRVEALGGFGRKTAEKILGSIESHRRRVGRFLLSEAAEYVEDLLTWLRGAEGVVAIAPTGSYRRRRESVGDIDILAATEEGGAVMDRLAAHDSVLETIARGPTKMSVRLRNGLQVDLRTLPPGSFGAGLQYFTGSQAHNIALRTIAKRKGLKVSEYGVFRGEERLAGETEEGVYAALGLPPIPPELREGRGEIEAALGPGLPELIERADIRGDLQMHTVASDGKDSIEEMALRARELGCEYIAITDHSRSETQAGGLPEEDVAGHLAAIDAADRRIDGIRVLKGMEVDILKDGSLDYSDEILARLDVVVASVHIRFSLSRDAQTRRILKAFENPHLQILAHPTGRLIGRRDPFEVDMKAVMAAAKERGIALELNAFPDRLDLHDEHCRMAREMGVKIVISTDAHRVSHLDAMRFGIGIARRGWLEKKDVLNTRPLDAFLGALRPRE